MSDNDNDATPVRHSIHNGEEHRYTVTDEAGNRWVLPAGRFELVEMIRPGGTWTDGVFTQKRSDVIELVQFVLTQDHVAEPETAVGLTWYQWFAPGIGDDGKPVAP